MALITVSGHLKDVSGANIAGSVVFQLVNYGSNIPRVLGTNALVPTSVTVTAAANGSWSTSIQGNDSIDPGAANPTPTTYYVVSFKDANGATIQAVPFNFVGAGPNNLDSQAALTTTPVPTLPSQGAITTAVIGDLAQYTAATTLGDSNIVGANVVTAASNFTSGDLVQAAASNKTTSDSGIAAANVVTLAGSQVLTNKTLTSPVINTTPTGTGIPTITLKKGTGLGNYTNTNTSYADVDTSNLGYTVTIPTGWKLAIQASGELQVTTGSVVVFVSLFDSSTIAETTQGASTVGVSIPFSLSWVIAGDGASHTIKLQAKTANASDAWLIVNASATRLPTMVFILSPSN